MRFGIGARSAMAGIVGVGGWLWPAPATSETIVDDTNCTEADPNDPPPGPDGRILEDTVFVHLVEQEITELVRIVGFGFDLTGPTLESLLAQLPPGTTLAEPPTVESVLTDTTFAFEIDLLVGCAPGTVILGDLTDPTSVVVIAGVVTFTTRETTIETQHVTETTTHRIVALGAAPAPPLPAAPEAPAAPVEGVAPAAGSAPPAPAVVAEPRTTG